MKYCKIKSSTVDAQRATTEWTELNGITIFRTGGSVKSNVQAIFNGKQLANGLKNDISKASSFALTSANMTYW